MFGVLFEFIVSPVNKTPNVRSTDPRPRDCVLPRQTGMKRTDLGRQDPTILIRHPDFELHHSHRTWANEFLLKARREIANRQ